MRCEDKSTTTPLSVVCSPPRDLLLRSALRNINHLADRLQRNANGYSFSDQAWTDLIEIGRTPLPSRKTARSFCQKPGTKYSEAMLPSGATHGHVVLAPDNRSYSETRVRTRNLFGQPRSQRRTRFRE